jgi:hypothetical protein
MTSATMLRDPLRVGGMHHSPAPSITRDRDGLVAVLQIVDQDGWDCRAARELLDYVRLTVVRPHVVLTRLRGLAADQAEATAWAATWEALRSPSIRTVRSPWGVLWSTARRAVLGECVAGIYCTSIRTAWSLAASGPESKPRPDGPAARTRPLGAITISELEWAGFAIPDQAPPMNSDAPPSILPQIVDALVAEGWSAPTASLMVDAVAVYADGSGCLLAEAKGWRPLAAALSLPPWQVRRVMVVMLGAPGWPGLVERLIIDGRSCLEDPGVVAALRSTLVLESPTPATAARPAALDGSSRRESAA